MQTGSPNISNKTEEKKTEQYLVRLFASTAGPAAQALIGFLILP